MTSLARSAPPKPNIGVLSHYSLLPHDEDSAILTTMDMSVRSNVLLCQHAMSHDDGTIWDLEDGIVFRVADLVLHFARRVDKKTGEETCGPMMTMIGPDGIYHSMSQYAFRDMQKIAILLGAGPPWEPPVKVMAARSKSRDNNTYQSILLAE